MYKFFSYEPDVYLEPFQIRSSIDREYIDDFENRLSYFYMVLEWKYYRSLRRYRFPMTATYKVGYSNNCFGRLSCGYRGGMCFGFWGSVWVDAYQFEQYMIRQVLPLHGTRVNRERFTMDSDVLRALINEHWHEWLRQHENTPLPFVVNRGAGMYTSRKLRCTYEQPFFFETWIPHVLIGRLIMCYHKADCEVCGEENTPVRLDDFRHLCADCRSTVRIKYYMQRPDLRRIGPPPRPKRKREEDGPILLLPEFSD